METFLKSILEFADPKRKKKPNLKKMHPRSSAGILVAETPAAAAPAVAKSNYVCTYVL